MVQFDETARFKWIQRQLRACCVTLPAGSTLNAEELLIRIGDAGSEWNPTDVERAVLSPLIEKLFELELIQRSS